ncbi:MAG: hypothetical protein ACSLFN_03745 [Candidatus Limnocylindrales bacterium]
MARDRTPQIDAHDPLPGSDEGRRTRLWLIALAALATLIILVLTSPGLWFYYDEWEVIRHRALDVPSLLRPHNEHFSAVLIFIHRGLVEAFGILSYTPFLAALWATHLFASATVYKLLREDGTAWQATAGTILFLVPNWGAHNLVTAFQIGFVLATALGCLALWLSVRRPALSAILLTVAVATQGVGLFYLVATGVRLFGRRALLWLALPAAVYALWFVTYGLDAMGQHGPSAPMSVPAYVLYGITGAFGQGGPVIGAIVITVIAMVIRRRAMDRLVIASILGLVAMFAATGLVRAQLGPEQALVSRYFTVALPFVLVIALAAWRSACERYPVRRFGLALVAIALVVGLLSFVEFRDGWPALQAADPAL